MVTLWSRKCERANMSMKPKTHKTLKVCLLDLNQLTELVHLIFQGTPHSSWWPLKQKIYISSLSFPQLQLWNPVISSIAPLYLAQGSRTVSMMSWWRLSVAKSIIRWKSTSRPAKFDIKRQKVAIWRQYKENWNFTLFGDKTNKPLSFLDCIIAFKVKFLFSLILPGHWRLSHFIFFNHCPTFCCPFCFCVHSVATVINSSKPVLNSQSKINCYQCTSVGLLPHTADFKSRPT